jgi:ribonuclease-3
LADLEEMQRALGVSFNNISLLEQCLVHRSYLNENPDFHLASNERLEFLGDAVLGLIVADKLYGGFPHLSEGEMTRLRAYLVRQETLAEVASSLKLGQYLYLGRGEEAGGGRDRPSNLAHALEAIIGAVFIDQGLAKTRKLVLHWLTPRLENALLAEQSVDCKSRLQELIQARQHLTPVYRLVDISGPDHARQFTVEVVVGEEVLGRGQGSSKQAAESEAALVALSNLSGSK